jgi:hypothetical protein
MAHPIRLLKFESKTCPVCVAMNKRGTVDNVKAEFPTVETITLCVTDEQGDAPAGTPYAEAYAISDVLDVQSLPCLVFLNADGIEIGRLEGAPSITQLRKGIDAALEEATTIEAQKALLPRILALPKA